MKNNVNFVLFAFMVSIFSSCTQLGLVKEDFTTKEGLKEFEEELISKFGKDAYFTDFGISHSQHGSVANVTVTSDPSSLKMGSWIYHKGLWEQTSDITLEIPDGAKAEDFMYTHKELDFDQINELVEKSKTKVKEEKDMDVVVYTIYLSAPDDADFSRMRYSLDLRPENGGTSFSFYYNMDGSLHSFDY
ncbi:hypothetical protein AAG747_25485 [Rapidithrix thailandica]|uniref:Lipoprotein n=1 Tax=Rapidithrix thailandica TaxID=413964 RepID=A0AAW9SE43_9BACT